MTSSRLKNIQGLLLVLLLIACFSFFAVVLAGDPQYATGAVPPVGYSTIHFGRFLRRTYFVKTWAAYAFHLLGLAILAISILVLVISRAIKRRDAIERDF